MVASCASPGQPVERRAPVPAAIADLSAAQSGNSAVLTFTLPRETVEHRLLKRAPAINIYRAFSSTAPQTAALPVQPLSTANESEGESPGGTPSAAAGNLSLVVTIPSALVSHYQQNGSIRYADAWTPEILKQHAGEFSVYMVRTAESRKKPSTASNLASVRLHPAPDPISDLKARLAVAAIDLSWTPPLQTPIGPAPPINRYEIYRSEVSSGASGDKPKSAPRALPVPAAKETKTHPEKVATTQSASYEDTQVQLGATYRYFVRSVVEYSGEPVQSADSNLVTLAMHDVFQPAAPTGLVAVPVPSQNGAAARIDLSWNLNSETDLAGYNVYRSEQQGTLGTPLNSQLLPTPVFSDLSAVAGQPYFYSVTAVDRSGNVSKPSAAISAEIPAESQPKQ